MSGYWRAYVDIALRRLLTDDRFEDATPEDIVDHIIVGAPSSLRFPAFERRQLVEEVRQRRLAERSGPPTDHARKKIAEMADLSPTMRRSAKGGRVSRAMMATRVEIDRDTIAEWVRRGWMTWPPGPKIPQD